MDNAVEKKLSELSRGFGTASGKLVRDTPLFSTDSSDDYDLRRNTTAESWEKLLLLRLQGENGQNFLERFKHFDKRILASEQINQQSLHKTFTTRGGNLILYAENLDHGRKRKKKNQHKGRKAEDVLFKGTCEDLTDSILRFGNGNYQFLNYGSQSLRDERLISVRPGYSPMRYVASASKLWDPGWVEKMLNDKAIHESYLEKYKKLKLPKIDIIPSSNFDPLLRDRPKPYTQVSLPDIYFRNKEPEQKSSGNNSDETLPVDNASSGYAKSFVSDNVLERKKMRRKKTMQLNKLELEMPTKERLPDIDVSDDGESNSETEWETEKKKSRQVVERTFHDLLERASERNSSQQSRNSRSGEDVRLKEDAEGKKSTSSKSSLPLLHRKSFDYAALPAEQKADLISQLLLQGIPKEATDVASSMSSESVERPADVQKRNSIGITDHASLPPIKAASIPDTQSLKGFKGNALHGSVRSAHSSKSKSSKDGSIKTNSSGFVVSSIRKLPPIKSEPTTPNVSKGDEKPGESVNVKLPQLSKRMLGYNGSKANRPVVDSGDDLGGLFIGGRAIDVADVEVTVPDDKESQRSLQDVDADLNDSTRTDTSEQDIENNIQDQIVAQENLTPRDTKPGHQSPDSGRSTGTGLTTLSDAKISHHDNQVNKEPMTPVVEESSRASMTSKSLSREGTLNRTSGSLKQKSFISEKSSLKGASLAEQIEDSLLLIKGIGTEDKLVAAANGDEEVFSDRQQSDLEARNESGNYKNGHDTSSDNDGFDEGVVVDEENISNTASLSGSNKEGDFLRGRTYTDTKTITESVDIVVDGDLDVDNESEPRDTEGSFISTSMLHAQAHAAARSALARPKSGRDLIEDMKVASAALGELFAGNISREASRSSKHRSRAGSDVTGKTQYFPVARNDGKRSASALSLKTARRMKTIDIDKLKANVSSLETLIDKKIHKPNESRVANETENAKKDDVVTLEDDLESDKSFPAASVKSKSISQDDIQIDIVGYESPEKSQLMMGVKENDDTEHQIVTAIENGPDTDEELFKMALNSIVDEVKDLKEKKAPKSKKARKVRINEDKFNIVRDRTSGSTPFRAGKPKENKPPKGLSRVIEQDKKEAVSKSTKIAGKKGKKKVGKKEKNVKAEDDKKRQDSSGKDSKNVVEKNGNEVIGNDVANSNDSKKSKDFDKYAVPITIKNATEKTVKNNVIEADNMILAAKEKPEESILKHGGLENIGNAKDDDNHLRRDTLTLTETDTEGSVSISANEDVNDDRVAAARARGRQLAAEKRRLRVEERRKQKEEAKKKAHEDAERAERLRIEGELEMQRRMENYKKQKDEEDIERSKKEQEEKEKMRRIELEKEREKRAKEEQQRKKATIAARLKLEEDMRRERQRIAKQIEDELRQQEEEKLQQMAEQDRLEYEMQKKLEEEERLRQEEEKQRLERERRLIEEEELKAKMMKLEEFHRMLLERAKFWEGMKNSKWFLELNQRLTRAFTFSYYDLLPAMLFPFTDLRPFTPKENSPNKLPPIPEEK